MPKILLMKLYGKLVYSRIRCNFALANVCNLIFFFCFYDKTEKNEQNNKSNNSIIEYENEIRWANEIQESNYIKTEKNRIINKTKPIRNLKEEFFDRIYSNNVY